MIIQGDFRDHIDQLEWDVLITDAPYGVNYPYPYQDYDDTLENLDAIIAALTPHLQNPERRAYVFTGTSHMFRWPAPYWVLRWISTSSNSRGRYGWNITQPILAYGQDPKLKDGLGAYPDSFQTDPYGNNNHPAEKPLPIMRWLIERVTRPGETIIDPMCGTGTTLIAAAELQRPAIGIEIDPTYVQIAHQRTAQQPLWTP